MDGSPTYYTSNCRWLFDAILVGYYSCGYFRFALCLTPGGIIFAPDRLTFCPPMLISWKCYCFLDKPLWSSKKWGGSYRGIKTLRVLEKSSSGCKKKQKQQRSQKPKPAWAMTSCDCKYARAQPQRKLFGVKMFSVCIAWNGATCFMMVGSGRRAVPKSKKAFTGTYKAQ